MTSTSINHADWTLFDRGGYIRRHGVLVRLHPSDDVACDIIGINGKPHRADDFADVTDKMIEHRSGWYLRRD